MTICRLLLCAAFAAAAMAASAFAQADAYEEACREALIALKRGDWETARTQAKAALEAHPEGARAKILLGRVALAEGRYAAAEEDIRAGLKLDPEDVTGQMALGDVLLAKRQFEAARGAYNAILAKSPGNLDATLKAVYASVGSADLIAASTDLLKLDQFNDTHPGYYFGKAAIARARAEEDTRKGKPDEAARLQAEAAKQLQAARTMYGNDTFARYMRDYLVLFPPAKPSEMDLIAPRPKK